MSQSFDRIPTTEPSVHAFDLRGPLSEEDVERMARTVRLSLDRGDDVALLLRLEERPGDALGALAKAATVRTCFGSLDGLRRYAVVGDPAYAEAILAGMNLAVPVDARVFDEGEMDEAWAYVGARPVSDAA